MSETTIQGYQYRRWDRSLRSSKRVWPAIVANELQLAMRHAKTRTLLITAGILVLGTCAMFYVISHLETIIGQENAKEMFDFLKVMLGIDLRGLQDVALFREVLWRATFLLQIKAQLFWVLIVVARIGAGLISKDLKSRALPIYFSKPITPTTYLLGKLSAVALFVALVTVVPNLLSLVFGIALTGGPGNWALVADIAAGLVASGVMISVISGAVILALSSLSADQRYVTVGWIALCILSIFAQQIILEFLPEETATGWLRAISLRDNVVMISERLLGVRVALERTTLPAAQFEKAFLRPMEAAHVAVMATLAVGSLVVAWRRVVRFSRSAASVQ